MKKKKKNHRWLLQIRLIDSSDPHFLRMWDINEPYQELIPCQEDAKALIDHTVETARIVDTTNDKSVYLKP